MKTTYNHSSYLFIIIAFYICIPTLALSGEYTGHCSVSLGSLITEDKFSKNFNTNRKSELGISFDMKEKNWPLSIAFDSSFLHAESKISTNLNNLGENRNVIFYRTETALGVKKFFNFSSIVKPFVSAGGSSVRIYGKRSHDSEMATSFGYWAGAGVYFELPKDISVGFQWKKSKVDIKIFDKKCNNGGDHFNLIAGIHF